MIPTVNHNTRGESSGCQRSEEEGKDIIGKDRAGPCPSLVPNK